MVEVLQAQGRWIESLDVLRELDKQRNCERADERLVHTIMGKANLGASTAQEMLQYLPDLIAIVQHSNTNRTRARAARALAYLVASMREEARARSMIEIVNSVPGDELDADSIGSLALAKSLILFNAGLTSASLTEVNAGIECLRRLGAANVAMAQLHIGVGAINSRNGNYEEALIASEHAFRMAAKLGNDDLITTAIGNLVMYCSRLGKHDDQSRWLAQIPKGRNAEFAGLVDFRLRISPPLARRSEHAGTKPTTPWPWWSEGFAVESRNGCVRYGSSTKQTCFGLLEDTPRQLELRVRS